MQSDTVRALKAATAEVHQRVEARLDLLDPRLTLARLADVVERFHGFWAAHEPRVGACLQSQPELAASLRWPRRARSASLRADVLALGGDPDSDSVRLAPSLWTRPTTADAMGWLYVAEGSTLGGAVLSRRLAPLTSGLSGSLRFFTPYPEGPGPMWSALCAVVTGWTDEDPERVADIASSAHAVFAALEAWLAPVRRNAAA